jgi:DNA polymerase-3 subunit beta
MQIAATDLSRALKMLVRLVPKNSTLTVLENILLEPAKDGVALTATDLTTEARVVVPASKVFSVCLSARELLEFVASIERDANIEMSSRGKIVNVTAAGATLELPQLPASAFPARIKHVGDATRVGDPADFLDALAWVSRAVGEDATRPQLTGVFFDGDHLVATDGHRLHEATIDGLGCPRALVPASAVAFVLRAFRGADIGISVSETSVRFESASCAVTTRMIDATFPPYEQVIPKGATFTMKVGTASLETGLKRVARRGSSRDVKPIKIRANGAIKVESAVSDVQLATTIGVIDSTHDGDDHVQGFNATYISEAIAGADEVATLRFHRADDPIVIETDRRVAVVMPFRI